MSTQAKRLLIAQAVFAGVLACRDASIAPASEGPARRAQVVATVSPETLRARNTTQWVGRLHNVILDELRSQRRNPNQGARDACLNVVSSLGAKGDSIGRTLSEAELIAIRTVLLASSICGARLKGGLKLASGVSFIPAAYAPAVLDTIWVEPSATGYAMIASIGDEVDAASSYSDLSSRLSPYLSTSQSMGHPDSSAVELAVAISLDSWDYWGPTTNDFEPTIDNEVSFLQQCASGNLENYQYEVDGVTHICLNSQWVQAGLPSTRWRNPSFNFVSLQGDVCSWNILKQITHVARWDGAGMLYVYVGTFLGWSGLTYAVPIVTTAAAATVGALWSYAAFTALAWDLRQC